MRKTAERHLWACKIIDPGPSDQILEIGCGTGILAGLLAKKLEQGNIHALDRSISLVEKAQKKNQRHLDQGRMIIHNTEFLDFESPMKFDKIVAFNVNFFQRESSKELEKIKELLQTDGRLYVFFQAPYAIDVSHADPIMENLLANGFKVQMVELMPQDPISALGVIVKP
jgi:cyclopropane fatty-acyl-phospholipid synthase-like methyltransferase